MSLKAVILGGGAGAIFFGEEDIVVLAGVEGRVEVNEVYRLIGYVWLAVLVATTQNLDVVT